MKRVMVLIVWALAASVGAQSLGELAAKEKERRKKNAESGAEVQEFSGQGEQSSESEETAVSDASSKSSPSPRVSEHDSIGDEGRNSDWPEVRAKYQERYDQAKKKLEDLEYMQQFCNRSMHGPQGGIPLGTVLGSNVPVGDCDALPFEIDRTKGDMARIENQCADDARRRGVPPGQARLRR